MTGVISLPNGSTPLVVIQSAKAFTGNRFADRLKDAAVRAPLDQKGVECLGSQGCCTRFSRWVPCLLSGHETRTRRRDSLPDSMRERESIYPKSLTVGAENHSSSLPRTKQSFVMLKKKMTTTRDGGRDERTPVQSNVRPNPRDYCCVFTVCDTVSRIERRKSDAAGSFTSFSLSLAHSLSR